MDNNYELSTEPNVDIGPQRVWQNSDLPIAGSLAEIRRGIDNVDNFMVEFLYERYEFVIGATLFKTTDEQVLAAKRQEEVKNCAVEQAKVVAPNDARFHTLVSDIWGILVPLFVQVQSECFDKTIPKQ